MAYGLAARAALTFATTIPSSTCSFARTRSGQWPRRRGAHARPARSPSPLRDPEAWARIALPEKDLLLAQTDPIDACRSASVWLSGGRREAFTHSTVPWGSSRQRRHSRNEGDIEDRIPQQWRGRHDVSSIASLSSPPKCGEDDPFVLPSSSCGQNVNLSTLSSVKIKGLPSRTVSLEMNFSLPSRPASTNPDFGSRVPSI